MPYWRLSGFYFFYFAVLGGLVPYFGLYLQSIGMTAADIGSLTAVLLFSRIVAPIVWGWVADHSRWRRMAVVRVTSAATVLCFAGVFVGEGFWWLALTLFAFSFFWNASLPLMEVATMNLYGDRPGGYGRIRLWGSLGFIACVTLLGPVVDLWGPWWLLPAMTALTLGIWCYSLVLPETGVTHHAEPHLRLAPVLRRPEVLAFLVAGFFMQLSHGPYYTFYTIYLEGHGYSKTLIGLLWAFAVVCEIGVFLIMTRAFRHLSVRAVLLASFLLAVVRWLIIGHNPGSLPLLAFAQVLHAATYAAFHSAAMQFVHQFFRGRLQYRGMAIYGGLAYGVGGAAGSYFSGQAWSLLGAVWTFNAAAACAIVAWGVAYCFLRPRSAGERAARRRG